VNNLKTNIVIFFCLISFTLGLFVNNLFFLLTFIFFYLSMMMLIKNFKNDIQIIIQNIGSINNQKKFKDESAEEHPIIISAKARLKKK